MTKKLTSIEKLRESGLSTPEIIAIRKKERTDRTEKIFNSFYNSRKKRLR